MKGVGSPYWLQFQAPDRDCDDARGQVENGRPIQIEAQLPTGARPG